MCYIVSFSTSHITNIWNSQYRSISIFKFVSFGFRTMSPIILRSNNCISVNGWPDVNKNESCMYVYMRQVTAKSVQKNVFSHLLWKGTVCGFMKILFTFLYVPLWQYFFKLFISNQNYIRFYKLIFCDSVWREEAYPTISPHWPSLRSAGQFLFSLLSLCGSSKGLHVLPFCFGRLCFFVWWLPLLTAQNKIFFINSLLAIRITLDSMS
jgi:hypothetical protein